MERRIPEDLYQEIIRVMPRLCVDIVPKYGNEVLLLKRRIDPLKGYWALAGGMVYKGEILKEAAIRIAYAELGLRAEESDLRLVGVVNFEDMVRHDVCLTYVLALPSKPEIRMDYQHRSFKWMQMNEIYGLGERLDIKVARQIECAFGLRNGLDEA